MTPPSPGLPQPARRPFFSAAPVLLLALGAALPVRAQDIGTVRDNEFRSRWANYQVDHPQTDNNPDTTSAGTATNSSSGQTGLLAAFGKSFDDLLRNGPLQVRANFGAGWEFTDEDNLRAIKPNGSDNSFFVAPAFGAFYNQELGPVTVSARYSLGYVYYLDQNYLAASDAGGIFSQTAGLDLALDGKRTTLASHTAFSDGDGNDIESGELRNLLELNELLEGTYQLTEFAQLGATANVDYQRYSGGTVPETDSVTDQGSLYGDYVITGKTKLRLEFDAGQQLQESSNISTTSDRYFYQAVVSANYAPAPKLTIDAGLGYGFVSDSDVVGRGQSGSHPVYRITIRYEPTAKTTASFHFGYEGVDVEPDFQLSAQYQFRINTSGMLSVYQNSNFSTYDIGQNLVTRGALLSVQQKFFGKVDVTVSGGVEQSTGYDNSETNLNLPAMNNLTSEDPYYFGGISLNYDLNSYLAIQGYYRGFTGEAGAVVREKGLQNRASVSLRLTF